MESNLPICDLTDAYFSAQWPDGLIEVDASHHIVRINPQASAYLGWSSSDLLGHSMHDALCKHSIYCDHHEMACPFISLDACSLKPRERYWIHKDQQNIAISYRILPTRDKSLLVIFQPCDVLGFQVAELAKLSLFTEINPAPLLEVDEQGLILFSNPAMTELMLSFGFDDDGLSSVLPKDLPSLVKQCIESELEIEAVESDAQDEDDPSDHRYYLWHMQAIKSIQKTTVLLCGLDITHKKQVEEQQKQFEQALESEKAKARKEYLAKMVHELRSPLNAVVGYASLLKNKLADVAGEKYLPLFDLIIKGGNQLAEQISLTLESSRVESGVLKVNITEFEVNPLAYDLAEKLAVMAEEKALLFEVKIPEKPLFVKADINHLRQIVINLLSNAIKYTPQGKVDIIVEELDDEVVGPSVAIAVKDTGSGISEEEKESVFELFSRQEKHLNTGIEGTGLGLAICVEMINLNHGRITLESELGVGSTFTAIFPKP